MGRKPICMRCGHKHSRHDWNTMCNHEEGTIPTHKPPRCLVAGCACDCYLYDPDRARERSKRK